MLDRLVKTCLAKDPDDRWQTAHDVKLQLQSIGEVGSQLLSNSRASGALVPGSPESIEVAKVVADAAAKAQSRRNRDRTLLILGTALITAIVAGALGYLARSPKPETKLNASITFPPNLGVEPYNVSFSFAPDGEKFAFSGVGDDGRSNLYLRRLDAEAPQLFAGTEGAAYPFWSPDGRSIGFFADKKLKRIEVPSGTVSVITDAPAGRGGSWSRDNVILFAPSNESGLFTVTATGGTPAQITTMDAGSGTDRVPFFLPDGKHALFIRSTMQFTSAGSIYVIDISTKKTEKLLDSDSEAQYAEPGFILFSRDGNLLAQPFNASSLKLSGEPVVMAQQVAFNAYRRSSQFAVSSTGLLLYAPDSGMRMRQLTWYNLEDGNEAGKVGEPARIGDLSLSPDEHHAAVVFWSGKSSSATSDKAIWLYDLARSTSTRLTFATGAFDIPRWAADGQSVYYVDVRSPVSIMRKSASGDSDAVKIYSDALFHGIDALSPDGQKLAFSSQVPRDFRIDMLPLDGAPAPVTFLAQDSNVRGTTFSPDGKWVSYMSDETGRYELYVTTYPDHKGKWQITKEGLNTGGWLKSPNQLAYVGGDAKLYIVDVAVHGTELQIVKTRNVFGGRALPPLPQFLNVANVITKDGKRLLFPKTTQDNKQNLLTLITNWSADLKKP